MHDTPTNKQVSIHHIWYTVVLPFTRDHIVPGRRGPLYIDVPDQIWHGWPHGRTQLVFKQVRMAFCKHELVYWSSPMDLGSPSECYECLKEPDPIE